MIKCTKRKFRHGYILIRTVHSVVRENYFKFSPCHTRILFELLGSNNFKMSSKVVNESSMFYMDFCPNCSNILHLDEYMGEVRHKCQVCPYFSPIKNITLASRSFYKLKVRCFNHYQFFTHKVDFKPDITDNYKSTVNECF